MFRVYNRKTNQLLKEFPSRKEAVFFCKVEQTLPLPDYDWEAEFSIVPEDAEELIDRPNYRKYLKTSEAIMQLNRDRIRRGID